VPTIVLNRQDGVTKFGNRYGTIQRSLDAIFDQSDTHIGFVIVVNVLDPVTHKTHVTDETDTFTALIQTVSLAHPFVVTGSEVVTDAPGTTTYVKDTDYTINYELGTITRIAAGAIPVAGTIETDYDWADVSKVLAADIIGGVDPVTGNREGIEALLDASAIYDIVPKILIAPEYSSSKNVMDALVAKAESLRAIPISDSGAGWTLEEMIAYRNNFDNVRAYVSYPLMKYTDMDGNEDQITPFSPYIAGVISHVDNRVQNGGWHQSPSNKVILGITGMERPIPHVTLSTPNSTANYLNELGIVTCIHYQGYRVWGNRLATTETAWAFISVRRTFDMIADAIEYGTVSMLDRAINKAFLKDLEISVQGHLNSIKGREMIIYGKVLITLEDNPPEEIAQGHLTVREDITPCFPAERITHIMTLVIEPLKQLFERR
jgi:phage tail sheath protein FI